MNRRLFNQSLSMTMLGAIAPAGCSAGKDTVRYEDLIADTWQHKHTRAKGRALQEELVRYATLAANSHNTQPWRFKLEPDRITIIPDFSRRCPIVDPDNHHLFASLGCATENLVLAAQAHGLRATVSLPGHSEDRIRVDLRIDTRTESSLFRAIPDRQCTRANYDGRPIPANQLAALEAASQDQGVSVVMFSDRGKMEEVLEYVIAGNSAQMRDEAFIEELKEWIRFNESTLVAHRDGIFSASSGNPTLPSWLGNLVLRFAFTADGENDKYRDQIRSSAGVIAFVSTHNDKDSWIRVGRCYQRFALQATALNVRHAFVNQAVEVPEVRAQFAQYLGIGDRRPDLLVRFGYGPLLPRSVRRPVEQVLV